LEDRSDRPVRKHAGAWVPYLHALVLAILLCVPALLNRAPIFYEDTQIYLSRPAAVLFQLGPSSEWVRPDKLEKWKQGADPATDSRAKIDQWLAGRSPYWGLVAYAFVLLLGEWGIVLMNALLAGVALAVVWQRMFSGLPAWGFYAIMAALTVITPLGAMVAFTTPDILSGLLILALVTLGLGWSKLTRADRAVLAAIGIFAVMSHDSHLAIAALLIPAVILLAWRHAGVSGRARLAWLSVLVAPLLAGMVGGVLFSQMAVARTGAPPLRLPHLTAQIVNLPAGQRYLREHCGSADFAVCAYRDRLPVHWIAFLFDRSPATGVFGVAPDEQKRKFGEEQYRFALAVAAEYPVSLASSLVLQGLRQVGTFDLADLDQRAKAAYFTADYPAGVYAEIRQSALWANPDLLHALDRATMMTAVLGCAALIILFLGHALKWAVLPDHVVRFAILVLLGILANDIVCGVLASPLGRFQARLIWLVPFLALALAGYAAPALTEYRRRRSYVAGA
jgi:hypothetical protein